MNKIKVLVIGHSDFNSTYGAATSIRNHFYALSEDLSFHFYHIYRKSVFSKLSGSACAQEKNLSYLKKTWLPIDERIFQHSSPGLLKDLLAIYIPNLFYKIFKKSIIDKIEELNPDIIHLNSIVLLPLLKDIKKREKLSNCKILMHVRELFSKDFNHSHYPEIFDVNSFVCIDQAVKSRLTSIIKSVDNRIVIQTNPFLPPEEIDSSLYKIFSQDCVVFSIAGVLGEDKGVDLVCRSFADANLSNSKLYVIGKRNSYYNELINKYNSNQNIVFTGEIKDLFARGGFKLINCLIRGEREFCTGRTVYESIFSGGYAILPGREADIDTDVALENFKEQVVTYTPNDSVSLSNAIFETHKKILIKSRFARPKSSDGNYSSYSKNFADFYRNLIG